MYVGDLIGRILAYWVVVFYIGMGRQGFLKITEVAHILRLLFSTVHTYKLCINFEKNGFDRI
jgi:hypothetical protein